MRAFEYAVLQTCPSRFGCWAIRGGRSALAGGTDLMALMKDDIVAPRRLCNIKELRERADQHQCQTGIANRRAHKHIRRWPTMRVAPGVIR